MLENVLLYALGILTYYLVAKILERRTPVYDGYEDKPGVTVRLYMKRGRYVAIGWYKGGEDNIDVYPNKQ